MRFLLGILTIAVFLGLIGVSLMKDLNEHRAFLAPVQGEAKEQPSPVAQASYAAPGAPPSFNAPAGFQGPTGQPHMIGPTAPPPAY
jgi:hypothetical protein